MERRIRVSLVLAAGMIFLLANSCSRIVGKALGLGPVQDQVVVVKDVMITARDGIKLATDIYKPKTEGKYPVILCRLPYGKNLTGNAGRLFAQRGYIFVIQDCRATFNSEGEVFIPFVNDQDDGRDTVKWISEQPWFNGKLGAWGGSYFGYTQWVIADDDQYLKAFYPLITTPSMYKALFDGGAFHYRLATGWSAGVGKGNQGSELTTLLDLGKKGVGPEEGFFNMPMKPDFKNSFEELGKMDIEELAVTMGLAPADAPNKPYPDATKKMIDLFAYPGFAYHSKVFNYFDRYENVKAPAMMVSGWYDIFLRGQLEDFMLMKKTAPEPARSGTRLIVGPWAHGALGSKDLSKEGKSLAMFKDMFMVDWFDYWIKGEKNKVESMPPVRIYLMGKNVWRDENEWPLARTKYTDYYFHGKGKANTIMGDGWISADKPAQIESTDEFKYDPKDPVPTLGGNNLLEQEGMEDQAPNEKRPDVLIYTSAPVKEEMEITGPLKVVLFAGSSERDTDFTAKLCVVKMDGSSMNLADGAVRARYRDGYDDPSPITAGKVYEYQIDLWATSYAFQPGEKIRVQISSSNFPRFDRNSNCAGEGGKDCKKTAYQTVYHDEKHPSRIILPVIPAK